MATQPGNQPLDLSGRARALEKQIRQQHTMGLKGLVLIYPKDKFLKGAFLPAVVTLCICLLVRSNGVGMQAFLQEIVESTISILPNLLGFLLGGYTILIGFGNTNLLKANTRLVQNRSISLFQMLSSIFALTIYLQAIALTIAVVAHFTLKVPLKPHLGLTSYLYEIAPIVNGTIVPFLLFLLLYSVLSLKDTVINVFGFAQQYHLVLTEERMGDEQKARRAANNNQQSNS